MAETCFLGIPASSAMSARSCSKGARSWSSGSPATVMLASFCSAAAPKAEIADARVRVILEESTEESWRWIHRSEPSTNASKAWTVEHLDGRLGVCHRYDLTHSIAIAYSCICNRSPSSYPSFAIRCPKALKTVCGRLEIVDRRDDHALISAAEHHRHDCRCHRTTIERRPATRTRGGRTEAQ